MLKSSLLLFARSDHSREPCCLKKAMAKQTHRSALKVYSIYIYDKPIYQYDIECINILPEVNLRY